MNSLELIARQLGVLLPILCWLSVVLTRSMAANVVRDGPRSVSTNVGEWAEFNCTVACTHVVDWYAESYDGDITDSCTRMVGGMMICREILQTCSDPESTGYKESLRILASDIHAGTSIAVQCAGIANSFQLDNCPPNLSYSRYALLTINPLPTNPPTTPPPTPQEEESSAPPSPNVPSPSPVVCATTTVTDVVTKTVMVTIKATPAISPPDISRGHSSSSHLSKLLSEVLSWLLVMLTGLLAVL